MFIDQMLAQSRFDFDAVMRCEHCGHRQMITTGYDDANYHYNVIPKMTCAACKKNRAGDVPAEPNEIGCGPNAKALVFKPMADLAALRARCETNEDAYYMECRVREEQVAALKAKLESSMADVLAQTAAASTWSGRAERAEKRLSHYEPIEGCEEAWKEYLSLRKQIRNCNDDDRKSELMARSMEVARPYDFTSLELREAEAKLARVREWAETTNHGFASADIRAILDEEPT